MFKKIICILFISTIYCQVPWDYELPWETVSVGVMGDGLNSATFQNNNILYGLDVLTFGLMIDEEEDISISASLFMPKVGYKIDKRSQNRLSTYYIGELYTIIPVISVKTSDSDLDNEIDDLADDMRETGDMLGMKYAYGIEYDFNDQFSLSTDIGFNILFNSVEVGDVDLRARLGNTFTKLSLNFSF